MESVMIGKTISHYKILEKLGIGGMGIIYKAEDTRLKRTVALKFLPLELAFDKEAKKRFIQEAQAASALEHPNICSIFDIGETEEGRMFMAMPCYEGETLKDRISRGPLKIEEALDIAVQIAQGLQKAHEKGIVHRDIKPANIFITKDSMVKIIDFGLAKLGGRTMMTKPGTTIGTVAYMSPEQARGEAVDRHSDIWSLGVLLYEMLTGGLPFNGDYEQAVVYGILNEEPEPMTAVRTGVPMELERITTKALAKNPADRYQHMDDLIVDLKNITKISAFAIGHATMQSPDRATRRKVKVWIPVTFLVIAAIAVSTYFILLAKRGMSKPAAPAANPQLARQTWQDSIAVLPFNDISPQKDQEYFCDGMMEDIITKLSSIRDLKVISRTSAMQYKKTDKSMGEIGKELGVGVVLEGSVQKEKDRIRVTAQLIRTADDAHLWAEKYDRELASVFKVQDDISMAIVDTLRLKLTSQEKQRVSEHPTDNAKAYEYYLKAEHQIMHFDEKSIDSAFVSLKTAIAILGDNALLYSGMAFACYMYANIGIRQEDYFMRAEKYAKKALALRPDLSSALYVLGNLSYYEDYPKNMHDLFRYFKKALAANPNEYMTLGIMAVYYLDVGKFSEASAIIVILERIDPLNPLLHAIRGSWYQYNCQFGPALEQERMLYQSEPTNPTWQTSYLWMLVYNGKRDEALALIDRMEKSGAPNVQTVLAHLLKYTLLKDKQNALRALTPEFQKLCRRDLELSHWVANYLSLLGAKEEALYWLKNAVGRGFISYPYLRCNPLLDNIRGEVRFKKLMEKAKYEWEHFEE
jgi:serine/threonine protein kinase